MSASSCEKPIYPPAVISYVNNEMKDYQFPNADDNVSIPDSLRVQPCLKNAVLRESVVSWAQVVALWWCSLVILLTFLHGIIFAMRQLKEIFIQGQSVSELDAIRGGEVMKRHSGKMGSICLVVRRPGWYFCREQALTLSVLAALYKESFDGFDIFGIVKESDVDGLAEFYNKYFTYPVYRDSSFTFYEALGSRKVALTSLINPLSIVSLACETWERMKTKDIKGKLTGGEGLVQGGIIAFDTKGKPLFMYQEETGKDLPIAKLITALEAIRRTKISPTSTTSVQTQQISDR